MKKTTTQGLPGDYCRPCDSGLLRPQLPSTLLLLTCFFPGPLLAMGFGNSAPVIDSFSASSVVVSGGSSIDLVCSGHDNGSIVRFVVTASAGRFANGATTVDTSLSSATSPASLTVSWTAPKIDSAAVTFTCTAWDNGGSFNAPSRASAPANLNVNVALVSDPPAINSITARPTSLFPGDDTQIQVDASDPDGGRLRYTWTAPTGSLSGEADGDPSTVVWTAPSKSGSYTLTVDVTNAAGRSSQVRLTLDVVLGKTGGRILHPALRFPARIAVAPNGSLYITDRRAAEIIQFNALGQLARRIAFKGTPMGLAVLDNGDLLVGDAQGRRVLLLDPDGAPKGMLGSGAGEAINPTDIVVDRLGRSIYVADAAAGMVKIYDAATLQRRDTVALAHTGVPSGLALDAARDRLFVADSLNTRVAVYDLAGAPVLDTSGSPTHIGVFGNQDGQLMHIAGLTLVDSSTLAVVDTYLAQVVFFDPQDGTVQGSISRWGAGPGQLRQPLGLGMDHWGRLLVTSVDNQRVEIFDLASSADPTAPLDDADMDQIADAWEVTHGYDPNDPTDAYIDADADGLHTLGEFRAGTNPADADSDHDGVSDKAELLGGFDPLDPEDQRPVADAGGDQQLAPSLVLLDGSASHGRLGARLQHQWTQISGPAEVDMQGSDSAQPWAVLRRSGTYVFELSVFDGTQWSLPDQVQVEVENLAPLAWAGPAQSVVEGLSLRLDGRFSADANQDALSLRWTQTAGPALLSTPSSQAITWTANAMPGLYRFDLNVTDARLRDSAALHVAVHGAHDHVPVAAIDAPGSAAVGQEVVLSARSSVDVDGQPLRYHWRQVAGPRVTVVGQREARFTPVEDGLYQFELQVSDGDHDSVPVDVEIAVDSADRHVPRTHVDSVARALVLHPVLLSCAGSEDLDGDLMGCRWTQVRGVPVPIEVSNEQARFVPLDAGTYLFEVVARDSQGPGTTAHLSVVVDDPEANHVPSAQAHLSADILATTWTLSAAASSDADGDRLGYTWTQLAGPPVRIDDVHASASSVHVPMWGADAPETEAAQRQPWPGRYRFAVYIDDGKALAPPRELSFTVPVMTGREPPDFHPPRPDVSQVDPAAAKQPHSVLADEETDPAQNPQAAPVAGCSAVNATSLWGLLPLLGLLLLGVRRRRGPWLASALGLLIAGQALATDPPHDNVAMPQVCDGCHQGHRGPGLALTKVVGNANLCMGCHQSNGINWQTSDQANPDLRLGTSHRWDAPATNVNHGAIPPAPSSEMGKRLEAGNIMCSTCHNQHGSSWNGGARARLSAARIYLPTSGALSTGTITASGTFSGSASLRYLIEIVSSGNESSAQFRFSTDAGASWSAPQIAGPAEPLNNGVLINFGAGSYVANEVYTFTAAFPLLRPRASEAGSADLSYICVQCHEARDTSPAKGRYPMPTSTDGTVVFSHPVSVAMGTSTSRAAPLDVGGADDGLTHNDLKLTAGKVTCVSCHRVHGADSNSQTEDRL